MRNKDPKIELLRRVPSLRGHADRQLAQLAPLVDEVEFGAGHVLVKEGSSGREAFLVVEGEAEVRLRGNVISRVGPGEFIGEMALLDHSPRSATVTAVTPMRVLVMDPSSFTALLNQPAIGRRLAADLAQRLRVIEGAPSYEAQVSSAD